MLNKKILTKKMTQNFETALEKFGTIADTVASQFSNLQNTQATGFNRITCSICKEGGRFMKKTLDGSVTVCKECEMIINRPLKLPTQETGGDEDPEQQEPFHTNMESTKASLLLLKLPPLQYRNHCLFRRALLTLKDKNWGDELLSVVNPCDCCNNKKDTDGKIGNVFYFSAIDSYLKVCEPCQYQVFHTAFIFSPFDYVPKK